MLIALGAHHDDCIVDSQAIDNSVKHRNSVCLSILRYYCDLMIDLHISVNFKEAIFMERKRVDLGEQKSNQAKTKSYIYTLAQADCLSPVSQTILYVYVEKFQSADL